MLAARQHDDDDDDGPGRPTMADTPEIENTVLFFLLIEVLQSRTLLNN